MTQVNSSELKNNIGKYLDLVLVEGEIEIVRRSRVIAKLVAAIDLSTKSDTDQNG